MANYVIGRLFLRFLKQRKAYHTFLTNFNSDEGKRFRGRYEETMNEYLIRISGEYFISDAFKWNRTEEGYCYWDDLYSQWYKVVG